MLHYRKWFLVALVVAFLASTGAAATMVIASPNHQGVVVTGTDQMMSLTGAMFVTLTDRADNDANDLAYVVLYVLDATSLANFRAETVMVANNSTAPTNIAFENGTAIVNNAATAGIPPMAAVKALMKTQGQNGVAREVIALRICLQHTLTTLAAG